jgi:hypothetical protein
VLPPVFRIELGEGRAPKSSLRVIPRSALLYERYDVGANRVNDRRAESTRFDCLLASSLRPIACSARCDVRVAAAVLVESDETTVAIAQLCFDGFRRLLLQIGG